MIDIRLTRKVNAGKLDIKKTRHSSVCIGKVYPFSFHLRLFPLSNDGEEILLMEGASASLKIYLGSGFDDGTFVIIGEKTKQNTHTKFHCVLCVFLSSKSFNPVMFS